MKKENKFSVWSRGGKSLAVIGLALLALGLSLSPAYAVATQGTTAQCLGALAPGGTYVNNQDDTPLPQGYVLQIIDSVNNVAEAPKPDGTPSDPAEIVLETITVGTNTGANGTFYKFLAASAHNENHYVYIRAWNAASLGAATHYGDSTLKLIDHGAPPAPITWSVPTFKVNTLKPVDNQAPNAPGSLAQSIADGTWVNSGTVNLTMNMSDPNNPDTLTPQVDFTTGAFDGNPDYAGTAVAYTGNPVTGTVAINVASLTEGDYKWQARVRDAGNLTSNFVQYKTGTTVIRVDKSGPTAVVITSPASPTKNTSLNFTWTAATDTKSGLAATPYYYLINTSPNTDANTVKNTGTNTAQLNATVNAVQGTNYLHVVAVDLVGNIGSVAHSSAVVVDTTGPTMTFNPLNGAINVALSQNVVITFSEAVDTGSLNYTLNPDPGGKNVAWSGGNTIATISHNVFNNSTQYTVTVAAVTDAVGNNYTGANSAAFTTVAPNAPSISGIIWDTSTPDNIKNQNYVYGTIVINGSNFGADPGNGSRDTAQNKVVIGGVTVSDVLPDSGIEVYSWSNTAIVCGVPLKDDANHFMIAGDLPVVVTAGGQASNADKTILVNPKVYDVKPETGIAGIKVTISGTALHTTPASNSVTFNGKTAAATSATQNTTIEVNVPLDTPLGAGAVTVAVNSKISNALYDYDRNGDGNASNDLVAFTVTPTAQAPNIPTDLAQSISDGTWVNSGTVNLTMNMSDPNNPDTLTPQVELTSGAFADTPNYSGTGVAYSGNPITGTVAIDISALLEGDYKWQARVKDAGNLTSNFVVNNHGEVSIHVDKSGPTAVVITSPASPTKNLSNQFSWTAAVDNKSGLATTPYYYLLNTSAVTDATTVKNTGTNTNQTTVAVAAPSAGTYYLHVVAVDAVGNIGTVAHSSAVVIDTTGPTMTFNPLNGATGVALSQNVVITFSEAVDTGSLNYTLNPDPGGKNVAWSGGNTIATISHNVFNNSTQYTVTVAAVTDAVGNNYTGANSAQFTTVAPNAPAISSITWEVSTPDNIKNQNYVYGTIVINGSNFGTDPGNGSRDTAQNKVAISGLTVPDVLPDNGLEVYYWSDTQIVCGVPLEVNGTYITAGDLPVIVTAGGQASTANSILVKPRVYSIAPTSGVTGTTVTFNGTAFGANIANVSASFNATTGLATAANNTTFTVNVPGAATTGIVQATVNGKTSNTKYDDGTDIIFTVTLGAQAPNIPTDLAQSIPDGTWVNSGTVNLTMNMSDPNNPDTLTPQVDFTTGAFDSNPDYAGTAVAYTGNPVTGTVAINVASLTEGDYKWQARVRDFGNLTSNFVQYKTGTTVIRVDKSGPTAVVITSPASPTKNLSNQFSWTAATDTKSGLAATPYYYLLNTSAVTDATTVKNTGTNTDQTTVSVAAPSQGIYYLHVVAVDAVGNIGTVAHSSAVVVDTTGPTMIFNPLNGATGVALSQDVVLTFSEPVNPSSLNYSLNPDPGGKNVAWNAQFTTATITHNAFANSIQYTVTVATVTDGAGNSYTGANSAAFTTVAPNAPVISSIIWDTSTPDNIKNQNYVYGTIIINGTNFGADPGNGSRDTAQNKVTISGLTIPDLLPDSGIEVYYWDDSTIVCGVPLEVNGSYIVAGDLPVIVTAGGQTTAPNTILVKPRVYSIAPTSGVTGTTVTFNGTAFGANIANVSASFNATTGLATAANNTTFTVNVPGAATTGIVQATVNGKTSNTKYDDGSDIIFTVTVANHAPVATDGVAATLKNQAVQVTMVATDEDQAADTLIYQITNQPTHGKLGIISDNKVLYTPNNGYLGDDTFSFKATDNQNVDSNSATITIAITDEVIPAPAITNAYNKKDLTSAKYVYVTPYDPNWSGASDDSLNLLVVGSDFGVKSGTGSSEAPAGASIAVKTYNSTFVDVSLAPDMMYYWETGKIELGIYDQLGGSPVVAGTAKVKVTTLGGVTEESFTIKPRVYGTSGTIKAGEKIKVTGTAFGTDLSKIKVYFNGQEIAPNSSTGTTIEVTVPTDAATGTLTVTINNVESNQLNITVEDTPVLSVPTTPLVFEGIEQGPNPVSQKIPVTNSGKGTLSWTASTLHNYGWLTIAPTSGESLVTKTPDIIVSVDITGLKAGTQNETIIVKTKDGSQSKNIAVSLIIESTALNKPYINKIEPIAAPAGVTITVTGQNFGSIEGESLLQFTNIDPNVATTYNAQIVKWGDISITAIVPRLAVAGTYEAKVIRKAIAASGNVTALESNKSTFNITAMGASDIATIYPNPFNPNAATVTIAYNPGTTTNIGVYIFDMTANLVIKVNTSASQITWDGRDQSKRLLADGAYLVRIVNEDTKALIAKGKILVVKK